MPHLKTCLTHQDRVSNTDRSVSNTYLSVSNTYLSVFNRQIGILLTKKQRQHRTFYIQKDVLPYAFC